MEKPNIVLGLDLSLVSTGCVKIDINTGKITEQKVIRSKPSGPKPIDELGRLLTIVDSIKITAEIKIVVIEGLAYMARNTSSLVQLAGLNYLIRDKFECYDIPFIIVAPTSLKKFITGKGNYPKDQVILEIYKRYGISFDDNNLADAFGLAQCGVALLGKNKIKLTQQQKEVVELLKNQL
jgi:crossover junction endodeoxyribonuclease RuvC